VLEGVDDRIRTHIRTLTCPLDDLSKEAKVLSGWGEETIAAYCFAGAGKRVPSGLAVATNKEGVTSRLTVTYILLTRYNARVFS
jgi:hypothetical protein